MKTSSNNTAPLSTLAAMRAEIARYVPVATPTAPTDSGITLAEHTMMLIGSAPSKALHLKDVLFASYQLAELRRKSLA